ncbi:hypothetical protein WME79_32510 [Sorangium sp. So ce726]
MFDAGDLGGSPGGDPLAILTLFADTPRALAVSPDGSRVYAAGLHSGNRTTSSFETVVPDGFGPDGLPPPSMNSRDQPAPEVGIIVQFNGVHWVDATGRPWDDAVRLSLPDKDVFVIDAMAATPAPLPGRAGVFTGVGTVLYNMAVNPVSGAIYVSNTDANNLNRFEGPGTFAGQTLRGHFHESRITVLGSRGVTPRPLNAHIDYGVRCAPLPNPGLYGTAGLSGFALETQLFKVPHLRNAYQKVGKFGFPAAFGFVHGDDGFTGDQVRGFGFIHDGSVDTLFRFHHALGFLTQFAPGGIPETPEGDVTRRDLEAFVLAFDSNLAPIVGQQVTLTRNNAAAVRPRIDLLMSRADAGECDLVVKGRVADRAVGYLYVGAGQLVADRRASPLVSGAALRALVGGDTARLTFTCAPPGSGERIALDRDADGFLDGDEQDACSDPADPASTP